MKPKPKKPNKLQEIYRDFYEDKFVAVNMRTAKIIDCDKSYKTLLNSMNQPTRDIAFIYFVKDKEFHMT